MWTHPDFEAVAALFSARTGIPIPVDRQPYVEAGIRRAMSRAHATCIEAFRKLVMSEPLALDEVIRELAVGETYFFRELGHFEFVRRTVLPDVVRRMGVSHVLRAWSAGCSTGEEPYSLAMLFDEEKIASRTSVLGTDISRRALEIARSGAYRPWSLRGEGAELSRRYLRFDGARWHVPPRIRARVDFRLLNLVIDAYTSTASGVWEMDLVFCRNVWIYFADETIAFVAQKLAESLRDGGYLVAGPSDPLLGRYASLETIVRTEGVFYRRKLPARVAMPARKSEPLAPPPEPRPEQRSEVRSVEPADVVAAASSAFARGDYREAASLTGDATLGVDGRLAHVRALSNVEPAEAERACAKAVHSFPLSVELRYLHASLLFGLGRDAGAEQAVRRALFLDRSLIVGHALLGAILKRRGESEASRRSFRNAYRICATLPPDASVPLTDGETVAMLGHAVASELAWFANGEGEEAAS